MTSWFLFGFISAALQREHPTLIYFLYPGVNMQSTQSKSLSFLVFLGPHLWHMEVPELGVKSELQLPAYATATVTPDLSHICKLHHSSQQHQILNLLSEAREGTCVLMDTCQIRFQ